MFMNVFISTVSLLNNLLKIFLGLGIFNRAISKDLGSDYYSKNSISQANIGWFKYELRGFYDFTLTNISIGQYHKTENK